MAKWKIKKIGSHLTVIAEGEDAGDALVNSGLNPSFWIVQGKVKGDSKKKEPAEVSDSKKAAPGKDSDSRTSPAEQEPDSKTDDQAAKE